MVDHNQAEKIRSHLERRMPFYVEMLRQMVDLNSFTSNKPGVNELGRLTAALFAPLGFTPEFVESSNPEHGAHVVLTRAGSGAGPAIGLVSHLDTVFPAEEEVANDFRWRVTEDRIYGPGTVDIKGGTVLIYMMLDALRNLEPQLYRAVTWKILLDSAEETGGHTFGPLCDEVLQGARAALVFEGGNMDNETYLLVVARKGMVNYRVDVCGRASHAGTAHEQGANAVVQLAHTTQRIADFTDYSKALTFNVGTFHGGSVVNRVPHFASADVEMRTFAQPVYDEGIAMMKSLEEDVVVDSPADGFSCSVDVTVTRETKPWSRNEATDSLFRIWQETGAALGLSVAPEERGGLSDGNHFWYKVPTLDGLGPNGGNAHCSERSDDGLKDQEYVRPVSFVPKTLLNTMAVIQLIRSADGWQSP